MDEILTTDNLAQLTSLHHSRPIFIDTMLHFIAINCRGFVVCIIVYNYVRK